MAVVALIVSDIAILSAGWVLARMIGIFVAYAMYNGLCLNIRGGYQVGGIVGKMKEGTLENSFTSGSITQINKGRSDYPMLTSDLIVGYFEQGVTLNGKIIYLLYHHCLCL